MSVVTRVNAISLPRDPPLSERRVQGAKVMAKIGVEKVAIEKSVCLSINLKNRENNG
jgi:hypothetical protein